MVRVIAPDGEIFHINTTIGGYNSEDTQRYYLHVIECAFDKHFSDDKEAMSSKIWREMLVSEIPFLGMSAGNRHKERVRISGRIRQLREGGKRYGVKRTC